MLIPIRSDAPLYHRPWGTGGIIAANVLVHLLAASGSPRQLDSWLLHYGTLNPLQWFTSVFLHAGWVHLLGNMAFLWVFGLIVEGKIGAGRFLAVYAGIAAVSGLLEQLLLLGASGASLGASGVIFGLMAMALVWAPENEVDCVLLLGLLVKTFEIRVRTLAFLYVCLEAALMALAGFRPSSALLHLIGAMTGLPLAVIMLRRGWVDCEGWDWFSRQKRTVSPLRSRARPLRRPDDPPVT